MVIYKISQKSAIMYILTEKDYFNCIVIEMQKLLVLDIINLLNEFFELLIHQ